MPVPSYPSTSFSFSANTVPTILVLAGVLFIFIHLINSAAEGFGGLVNTTWFGIAGVISLILGIVLFLLISGSDY